jgi:hypothetical protein
LIIKGEPHELKAKNINPYLVEGKDLLLQSRKNQYHNFPEMLMVVTYRWWKFILSEDEKAF